MFRMDSTRREALSLQLDVILPPSEQRESFSLALCPNLADRGGSEHNGLVDDANLGRRGEVEADSDTLSDDERDGDDEYELERERDDSPSPRRDIRTFSWVMQRATCPHLNIIRSMMMTVCYGLVYANVLSTKERGAGD